MTKIATEMNNSDELVARGRFIEDERRAVG
jgi:hypothetical protein